MGKTKSSKKTQRKRRGKKKRKDPNAPKRPLSAYFHFLADRRSSVVKENPQAKMAEISKICGEEWRKLGPRDKQKYEELNKRDKARYEMEMKNYTPPVFTSSSSDSDTARRRKRKKDKNAPKRALSAYLYFLQAKRPEITAANPGATNPQILSLLAQEWAKQTEESIAPYKELAAKDKARYQKEKAEYDAKHPKVKKTAKRKKKAVSSSSSSSEESSSEESSSEGSSEEESEDYSSESE